MSTDHNRIKVADLEKNAQNKTLITNSKGELEFSDFPSVKAESYNALDYTAEGKALDARQGKVLKDMINDIVISPPSLVNDLTTGGSSKALSAEMGKTLENTKLTGSIATDAETQIDSTVSEDKKVVSRSKLFNWWENQKSKIQTIKAVWNFNLGIKVNNSTGNYVYTTQMIQDMFIAELVSAGYGTYKVQYGWNDIRMYNSNNFYTQLGFLSSTQNNNVNLPNKSGTVALINDFVTTAKGTASTAPLVIPNGVLTTVPQNGAIERDENGQLWETHAGIRSKISSSTKSQSYKVYTAIINQSGVNPPIPTVLENTLSGNINFEYSSRGTYTGSLTNAFPDGKTFFIVVPPNAPGSSNMFYIGRVDNNNIALSFRKNMTAFDDIVNAMLEIRVYE